ncbi:hypothetical protein HQ533_01070 [Candidatus Woesearchaeota archaeon]|nr:hypothetical protein [Candidatus Woesearchaeota archaeon]
MEQVYVLKDQKKMSITKKIIEEVVTELVGEEALPIVFYLRGKQKISEFIIAEELDLEIHKTRNLLYRLYEHNIAFFLRKKDKIKGWYICYWDFNEKTIPELALKIKNKKIEKIKERLEREESNTFYMCKNACARMTFDKSMEYNFKCPECGEIMHEQDNKRTIEFLTERLKELQKPKKKK